jgi:hypothetical protein
MRKIMTIAIGTAIAATAGCGADARRGEDPGPTVQRDFQVGNFEQIEVAGPHEVRVRTGANASVSASGPQNVIERLTVEVEGNRLLIRPREERRMVTWGRRGGGKVTFEITVPQLSAASIAGSGTMAIDRVRGDRFAGAIAGSGDMTVDEVEVETMNLSIAGSGDLRVRAGQARTSELNIAGSGDLDTQGVRSESAKISIAGSGDIKSQATGSADVSIIGSGDVSVSGGAKCNVKKTGSGNVRCS